MMIYTQHYFRRRMRKIPSPSCLPIAIMFALLSICLIVIMPPIMTGVMVELPKLNTQPVEIFDDFKYVTIIVNGDGTLFVNNSPSNIEDAGNVIKLLHKNINMEDIKIFIRAQKDVNYNTIIDLFQALNNDGFVDITLVGKYTGGIQNIR